VLRMAAPKAEKRLPKVTPKSDLLRVLLESFGDSGLEVRNRAILTFLYGTGARVSELVSLDRGDIDFRSGLVKLRGKGDKVRYVPAGAFALERVRGWMGMRVDRSEAVFTSLAGRRLTTKGPTVRHPQVRTARRPSVWAPAIGLVIWVSTAIEPRSQVEFPTREIYRSTILSRLQSRACSWRSPSARSSRYCRPTSGEPWRRISARRSPASALAQRQVRPWVTPGPGREVRSSGHHGGTMGAPWGHHRGKSVSPSRFMGAPMGE